METQFVHHLTAALFFPSHPSSPFPLMGWLFVPISVLIFVIYISTASSSPATLVTMLSHTCAHTKRWMSWGWLNQPGFTVNYKHLQSGSLNPCPVHTFMLVCVCLATPCVSIIPEVMEQWIVYSVRVPAYYSLSSPVFDPSVEVSCELEYNSISTVALKTADASLGSSHQGEWPIIHPRIRYSTALCQCHIVTGQVWVCVCVVE